MAKAKTKWKKIIVAGPLVIETIYPAVPSRGSDKARAAKRKLSSAAQQRMNMIYSSQKLEFMIAANFIPGDLVCTLTYDDLHLPANRKEAEAKLKYFRSKLSSARKKLGQELVMIWNTEHKHGDGRYHHHVIINATGDDYELIVKLWGQGKVEINPLQIKGDRNYASLAEYMCKERPEKVGQRCWSYTRNAKKPETDTFRVEDDTQLQAPEDSIVLRDTGDKNQYGSYKLIKYLLPQYYKHRSRRRRQRK